jgi:hypothetical protein
MNIAEGYDYLVRAPRDLWAALAGVADEVLSRALLGGAKTALHQGHCVSRGFRGGLLDSGGDLARTAVAEDHSGL